MSDTASPPAKHPTLSQTTSASRKDGLVQRVQTSERKRETSCVRLQVTAYARPHAVLQWKRESDAARAAVYIQSRHVLVYWPPVQP